MKIVPPGDNTLMHAITDKISFFITKRMNLKTIYNLSSFLGE